MDSQNEVAAPKFASPVEGAFSQLLDRLGLDWAYEPRTFALQEKDGRIVKGFTPDFYLPQLDLWVELTTQNSRTQKNQKLRQMNERYPDVNVIILFKEDLDLLGGANEV